MSKPSLDSLPPELLRQIIENTLPSTLPVRRDEYRLRQASLSSLCLVCHRFISIAQRFLFETVWVTSSPESLDRLVDLLEAKGWINLLRMIVIKEQDCSLVSSTVFERLVKIGSRLHTLALDLAASEPPDLSVLSNFPQLEFLRLFGAKFIAASPITLPNLVTLYFDTEALAAVPTLLNPVSLPLLRSLALVQVDPGDHKEQFRQLDRSDLLPQLKTIFSDWVPLYDQSGLFGQVYRRRPRRLLHLRTRQLPVSSYPSASSPAPRL